jgi:hypothetical protein
VHALDRSATVTGMNKHIKKTPWLESASELYGPSDRRFMNKHIHILISLIYDTPVVNIDLTPRVEPMKLIDVAFYFRILSHIAQQDVTSSTPASLEFYLSFPCQDEYYLPPRNRLLNTCLEKQ